MDIQRVTAAKLEEAQRERDEALREANHKLREAQREADAKLQEAQLLQKRTERERDEALQGMALAQVLLIPALLGSICDQMSDDMFPLYFIQREKGEALTRVQV